jgi:hypothetical protein
MIESVRDCLQIKEGSLPTAVRRDRRHGCEVRKERWFLDDKKFIESSRG